MARSAPPLLICLEGSDGAGKTTQVGTLADRLKDDPRPTTVIDWNSSPVFRKALRRGMRTMVLTPLSYALGQAASFADTYCRQIVPALDAGGIALCDRYCGTAYARDAARGCDPAWDRAVYAFARRPDLTVYLDIAPKVALARLQEAGLDPEGYEAGMDLHLDADPARSFLAYQAMVRRAYLSCAKEYNWVTVDGSGDEDGVADAIWDAVGDLPGVS